MGRTFETLTASEIVEINRRMIQSFGGIFFEGDRNLANPDSLEFVLAEIQGTRFDREPTRQSSKKPPPLAGASSP